MSQIENAIVVSPLDDKMEQALSKVNVTNYVIDTLKAKYGDLKLRSMDDKEMYLEIKVAAKEVAKVRNAVVKVCKEGREEAVKIQKQWIAKEKEVIGRIAEVENPLDAQIEAFDNHAKDVELQEKRRQEEQYMSRTQALTKMGALYHDASFTLGEFTLDANLVKESSQNVWEDEILPRFMEEHLKIEGERVEKERKAAAERAEFERQQAEFKKQQEEFQRKVAEERMKEQEAKDELQRERFVALSPYMRIGANANIDMSNLWAVSEIEFNDLLTAKKAAFEQWEAERIKAFEEAAAQRERARIEEEQRQLALKKQQEEARKLEEMAKAGDKAIWAHFTEQVQAIELPHLKSGQYRKIANIAKEKILEQNKAILGCF
jgi:hypothetical protein